MAGMGRLASEKGSALLGARVDVGEVRVDSPWSLTVRDVALYDKRDALFLKAESATVRFSLFGMLAGILPEDIGNRSEPWEDKEQSSKLDAGES